MHIEILEDLTIQVCYEELDSVTKIDPKTQEEVITQVLTAKIAYYPTVDAMAVKFPNDIDTANSKLAEYMRNSTLVHTITPRQARLALLQSGLLDEVELLLANDRAMQIWWEYSLEIQRSHPHIIAMGVSLGMTDVQVDELFLLGASL